MSVCLFAFSFSRWFIIIWMLTVLHNWAHLHRHLVIERKKFKIEHERAIICICFRVTFFHHHHEFKHHPYCRQLKKHHKSLLQSPFFLLLLSRAHHFFSFTFFRFFTNITIIIGCCNLFWPEHNWTFCSLSYSLYSPLLIYLFDSSFSLLD